MIRLALAAALLAGCVVGPAASPEDLERPLECADAPLLTWETFGEAFLISRCQNCHASTAPDRRGAPPAVTLDHMDNVRAFRDRITARVVDQSMPPGGGLLQEEVLDLQLWMECDPCTFSDEPGCDAITEIPREQL